MAPPLEALELAAGVHGFHAAEGGLADGVRDWG